MRNDHTRVTNKKAGNLGSNERRVPQSDSAGKSSSRSRSTKSGAEKRGSGTSGMGGGGSPSGTGTRDTQP